jgi:hypothetical protein
VFFKERLNGKKVACIVGVHKAFDSAVNLNICTLITDEVTNKLKEWMVEMGLIIRVSNANNMETLLTSSYSSGPRVYFF